MQKDRKLWSIADRGIGVVQISTHLKGSAPPPPSPPPETLGPYSKKMEESVEEASINAYEELVSKYRKEV